MAAYQEFYVNPSTGSNLNSGFPIGGIYPVTTTNGAYTRNVASFTDRYTAASGTPFSGISVGDYVSVYNDAASAPTPFIARVKVINGGGVSIDIDNTLFAGTQPATVASGKTATVGGEWLGPNGASGFPFNFLSAQCTDGGSHGPRCNFKNNATYNVTAAMTNTLGAGGTIRWQGYTSTPGDGGRAIFDGGTSGASYVLFTCTQTQNFYCDLQFSHNGATGAANGVSDTGGTIWFRCVFNGMRKNGLILGNSTTKIIECEAYQNNSSSSGDSGGFCQDTSNNGESVVFLRCYSHDNTGLGFVLSQGGVDSKCCLIGCIADSNTGRGISPDTSAGFVNFFLSNCDCYNNGGDGVHLTNSGGTYVENCNLVKNGGFGIGGSGNNCFIYNCGFGSGSDANTSGQVASNFDASVVIGSITYTNPTNPWKSPTTGDFRLIAGPAFDSGRGNFTQTGNSKTGAQGYPDVGSCEQRSVPPRMFNSGAKL